MNTSVLQLFSIGIGPSSSHTVGPMRAAARFVCALEEQGLLSSTGGITTDLYGSLALTGRGHGSDKAILLGLSGKNPESMDPAEVDPLLAAIRQTKTIRFGGSRTAPFVEETDLLLRKTERLPFHSNGIRFTARDPGGKTVLRRTYYSIGGGFVLDEAQAAESLRLHASSGGPANAPSSVPAGGASVPFPFSTAKELLGHVKTTGRTIASIVMENEKAWHDETAVREGILRIWDVMQRCVERGLAEEGDLPGGLGIRRRAPKLWKQLQENGEPARDPGAVFDWVSLFALAVNEENASGGRVVTAPTNGAAGVIPSVLHYYRRFVPLWSEEGVIRFFLTATAVGNLYRMGASLSAAEVGCQGEVGVACSMAAAGLTATLGGTDAQVENAAEIGMEHNLGLTCDPVGGLVQVPCIERNTMGAVKAINAARLALRGDGKHRVSLDQVIRAMRQTGEDMKRTYKETSEAGLASSVPVSVPEC
jgi:L-serine dehydratase